MLPHRGLDAARPFADTARMGAAHLTVDLDAVAANWRALDALSQPHVETGAAVKADGYGTGATDVARKLHASGVRSFFVAVASEGVIIRRAVGTDADIHVFSGHMHGDTDLLQQHRLIPMLNAPEQVARHFQSAPGHPFGVQLDTGMNRLGMERGDWDALKSELMDAGPRLVMSHLACADEPDHPMNAQQLHSFRTMTDGIAHRRSLAATGGILLGTEYHFDLVRPGIGLYGGRPFDDATPVVALSAPIVQTRIVRPFETVGYGNTWTANVESCIATISAGYADGLIRGLGSNGRVWAGDVPCPIVGRVSMDLITVDVTHLEEIPETLDILGPHQSVDDLADAAGTIGYEILTSLGHRYARHYEGAA
ncbi:alanine racemase [Silicimonas algicola]|uniref:Alanine racemase n=2 Tax=Silicimonas algicola TaxID=1826607 RepID=A0A316G4I9_9RHOB|nr:alanine racemase [Silicimonas algicola]